MKNQGARGFTLIEMMIVLAIIGILAAVAIPVYQDFVARAHSASALASISPIRSAVEDLLLVGTSPATIDEAAVAVTPGANTLGTIHVGPFAADGTGSVTFVFDGNSNPQLKNGPAVLALNRNPDGIWTCNMTGADAKFVPTGC